MNTAAIASLPRRFFHGWIGIIRHLLPPTLYFFIAFNLIVFTTNLLAHNYWFNLSSFLLASTTALVVGKVVLVVDKVRIIDKFRGAPLIQPILYKTIFYSLVVTVVRFLEKILDVAFEAHSLGQVYQMVLVDFTWHRFVAVQVWIFVCFLLYVTASELNALIGPYARLRPGTVLADGVHVGNFVETKNARIGMGSKANHLTYLGDAVIGTGTNIGAGTITCNYDGVNKSTTTIGDRVFVGSNSSLVAPVTLADGATIGAGSVISKNAPADKLTVARARQMTVEGWQRPMKK